MYPRNAEPPPHFAVGQVVQISDGAIQTTGVSARVKTGSGDWGAAAGTLAVDATSGAWTYTPTQGETDAETFSVAIYKAGCIGASVTIATRDDDALQAAAAAAIAAAGLTMPSGEYTQTVTVSDGDEAPIQGATVAIYSGDTLIDLQPTNSSGVATPACDAGTYTLRVTYSGLYTSSATSITVTGAAARAVTLERISYTPSTEPDSVTVRWRVMDDDGRPCAAGEGTVRIRVKEGPGVSGFAWDKGERIATTDASGYVEFPDVPAGCTLRAKLGAASAAGEWFDVTIPSDATSPYEPGEILGTVP